MTGLLSSMLMGPSQRLLRPGMAQAAAAPAVSGGLLAQFNPNIANNRVYQAFDRNREPLVNMLLGGVGAESPLERMRGMAGGLAQGNERSALLREERRKQEQAQQQINATMQAMQKAGRDDLVQAVQGGLPIGEAWKTFLAKDTVKPTDDMREYDFARQQGFGGSFQDWMTSNRKAGATNVTTNVGQSDKFRDEIDKRSATMIGDLVDSGYQAQRSMIQIDRMGDLLERVPTGAGSAFKQIAGNFGIASEGLSEIQAAQAIINQLVPQQRPPGSGPMSDADLELFKQSLPRIINQPGGNKLIIDTMRGIAEYTAAQGQIAQMVATGQITVEEGMQRLNQLPNPLEQIRTSAVSGNPSADYKKRYGLE